MAKTKKPYADHAAKREPGGFVALPHVVIRHPNFSELSPRATKLLMDLLSQYKGDNNGDLATAEKLMRTRGWRSKGGIEIARNELLAKRFIVLTRQGGRNKPNLYAVTFYEINWCEGKLDIKTPNRTFMGSWRTTHDSTRSFPVPRRQAQQANDYPTGGAIAPKSEPVYPAGRACLATLGEFCTPPAVPL
jgi:hypothetical protein